MQVQEKVIVQLSMMRSEYIPIIMKKRSDQINNKKHCSTFQCICIIFYNSWYNFSGFLNRIPVHYQITHEFLLLLTNTRILYLSLTSKVLYTVDASYTQTHQKYFLTADEGAYFLKHAHTHSTCLITFGVVCQSTYFGSCRNSPE